MNQLAHCASVPWGLQKATWRMQPSRPPTGPQNLCLATVTGSDIWADLCPTPSGPAFQGCHPGCGERAWQLA